MATPPPLTLPGVAEPRAGRRCPPRTSTDNKDFNRPALAWLMPGGGTLSGGAPGTGTSGTAKRRRHLVWQGKLMP